MLRTETSSLPERGEDLSESRGVRVRQREREREREREDRSEFRKDSVEVEAREEPVCRPDEITLVIDCVPHLFHKARCVIVCFIQD